MRPDKGVILLMTQLVVPELPAFTVAVLTSLMSLVLFLTAGPRESPSLAYLFLLTAFYNMKSSTSDAFATVSEMLTTSNLVKPFYQKALQNKRAAGAALNCLLMRGNAVCKAACFKVIFYFFC